VAALGKDSRLLDEQEEQGSEEKRRMVERGIREYWAKTDRLLDAYLDGLLDEDAYRRKGLELGRQRLNLEQQLEALGPEAGSGRTAGTFERPPTGASNSRLPA
jgi:hypothetical protein